VSHPAGRLFAAFERQKGSKRCRESDCGQRLELSATILVLLSREKRRS